MKKILIYIIILLIANDVLLSRSTANDPLCAYKLKGKWYFLNHQGREMFQPKVLEDVMGYGDGFFTVRFNDGTKIQNGMMNLKGEIVYKPDCDKLSIYAEGMAITIKYTDTEKTLGKYGFINLEGKQIIPNKFNGVSFFSEGLAFAADGPKKGYIDKTGKFVFTLDNMAGNLFSEGMAVVNNDKYKSGCIDKTGKLVIPCKYDELGDFTDGLNRYYIDTKVGYIDKTGKIIVKADYDDAKGFSEGFALVAKSNSRGNYAWGFINKKGELISKDFKYEVMRDFSEKFASIKTETLWTFVDNEGNLLFAPTYTNTDSFKNGIAWTSNKLTDRYGYIDQAGTYIVEIPKCEKLIDLRFNRKVGF